MIIVTSVYTTIVVASLATNGMQCTSTVMIFCE